MIWVSSRARAVAIQVSCTSSSCTRMQLFCLTCFYIPAITICLSFHVSSDAGKKVWHILYIRWGWVYVGSAAYLADAFALRSRHTHVRAISKLVVHVLNKHISSRHHEHTHKYVFGLCSAYYHDQARKKLQRGSVKVVKGFYAGGWF